MMLREVVQQAWMPEMRILRFSAQLDPVIPEDLRFHAATASGTLELHVDKVEALKKFKLGACYLIDFAAINDSTEAPNLLDE